MPVGYGANGSTCCSHERRRATAKLAKTTGHRFSVLQTTAGIDGVFSLLPSFICGTVTSVQRTLVTK